MLLKIILPVILTTAVVQIRAFADFHRFKREIENFNTTLEKMQMISRVVNGISLQQGLFKGTIPSDELISEFLDFGDVKQSDIDQIDMDKLKSVVEKIEKLPSQISRDKGVIKIENRLIALKAIKGESKKVEKLVEPSKDYLTEVGRMKKLGNKWGKFEEYTRAMITFLDRIDKVEKNPKMDEDSIKKVVDELLLATRQLETVYITSFKIALSSDKLIGMQNQFTSFPKFIRILPELQKHSAVLKFDDKNDNQLLDLVGANIKTLSSAEKEVKASTSSFRILEKILIHRHHQSGNRDVKHAPAFAKEFADLNLIPTDLQNESTKMAVANQTKFLNDTLKTLPSLTPLLNDLDKETRGNQTKIPTTLPRISTRLSEFSDIKVSLDSFESKLKDIQNAAKDKDIIPKASPNLNQVFDQINLLFEQLKTIAELAKSAEILTTPDAKAKLKRLRGTLDYEPNEDFPKKMKALLNDADLKFVIGSLRNCQGLLLKIMNEDKKKIVAVDALNFIYQNYKDLTTFVAESQKFFTVMKTLNGIAELDLVDKVIEAVQAHSDKSKTVPPKEDFDEVVNSVVVVKTKLAEFDALIGKMKGAGGAEMDTLMGLGDFTEKAKTIGLATRGLTSMKLFMEQSLNYVEIEQASSTIKNEAASKQGLDPVVSRNLNVLEQLGDKLENLNKSLTVFRDSVKLTNPSKLVDYSDLFEKAKNIPGINVDFMAIRRFAQDLPGNVKKFLPVLETLDEIGLDFAKHKSSFDAASDSLNWLDMTFAKLSGIFTSTTTLPPKKPEGSRTKQFRDMPRGPSGSYKTEETTSAPIDGKMIFAWAALAFAISMFILLIDMLVTDYTEQKYGLCVRCVCLYLDERKRKREAAKANAENKTKPSTPAAATPIKTPPPPSSTNNGR